MLVADLQPGHPPVTHIRMVAIRDVNASPPAHAPLVAVIEVLQSMQIMQVPNDRRMLAINFERIQRLVPASVSRCFERRERSVLKARQKRTRIVDADRLNLARQIMPAALDE